ncbi:MAG: 5-formyltetrahydrofolate cyclo-ligase [Desulfurococcaceae archaeon]
MVWNLLEQLNVAAFPRPVYGRIPNFKGAEIAAQRVTTLKEWQKAHVVKASPDAPQYYLRHLALREGKLLIMASPRLRAGFIALDPDVIPPSKLHQAATINGAFKYGKVVKLSEIPVIDVVVTGCVAVDPQGVRLGKGGGFAELEYGILRELGAIGAQTPVITTIHDLQVVGESIPLEVHDLTVDYYATPTRLVKVEAGTKHKPKGIYWELLTPELRGLGVIRELLETKKLKQ